MCVAFLAGPPAKEGASSYGMVEWRSIGLNVWVISQAWDVWGFITFVVFVYSSIRLICLRKVCKRTDLFPKATILPPLCWQLSVSILRGENPAMYTLSVWVCYLSDGFKVPHTLKDSPQDERKQIMCCVNCSTILCRSVDTCSRLLATWRFIITHVAFHKFYVS